ncbi:MAG: hypothetical protein LUC18_04595 [Porphyromonadaceae bacterium]|nr:hypothetical protein [Porphyromonadaceae bacterium]
MKELKDFVNGLPKLDESRVLSNEEQEMVEAGDCESCESGCLQSKKKQSIVIINPSASDPSSGDQS